MKSMIVARSWVTWRFRSGRPRSISIPSSRRRSGPSSRAKKSSWIPAFAGMTGGAPYNSTMISSFRAGRVSATYLILVAAVAAAIGLWLGGRTFAPSAPKLVAAVMYPAPRELPDFKLQRADGTALTKADWNGRWTVATFKQVFAKLKADGIADKVRFDFISVDPERDTPEQLTKYVGYFDKDFVA